MNEMDERAVMMVFKGSELTTKMIVEALKGAIDVGGKSVQLAAKGIGKGVQKTRQTGSQSLSQLKKGHDQISVVSLEGKADLLALRKELKKYKVDFSVVKDGTNNWKVFFKAKDAEVMATAFENVVASFDKETPKETNKEATAEKASETKEKEPNAKNQEKPVESTRKEPPTDKPKASQTQATPTVKKRLDKAKKEAQAFNQAVKKDKVKSRGPKAKGMEK